jgi:diheme cytochrome c
MTPQRPIRAARAIALAAAMAMTFAAQAVPLPVGAIAHAMGAAAASGPPMPAAVDASWKHECGSCHVAYPPGLLPANGWQALMRDLERHFGTDASVDPATAATIAAFLEAHAGRDVAGPTIIRITETPRFRRKHDEIAPAVFRSPKVGSAANCAACHRDAANGRFGEHDVHIPR